MEWSFGAKSILVYTNLCGDMATLHGNDLVTNSPKLKFGKSIVILNPIFKSRKSIVSLSKISHNFFLPIGDRKPSFI
jgi:hypothetical protein